MVLLIWYVRHMFSVQSVSCSIPLLGSLNTLYYIHSLGNIQIMKRLSYTQCPRRNVPDFGRVFLMLKYTDITQNTYVQS
jgi:hypothetical protein